MSYNVAVGIRNRHERGKVIMPLEFDITLTQKDMFRFNLVQTYSGLQGWSSVVISVIAFILAGITYGEIKPIYTVLYIGFGILLLVYIPVSLYLRSKHSFAVSAVLREPLHYSIAKDGIHVSQKEESAILPWGQVYKIKATKNLVLIYSSRIHAYVIPRQQLGEAYQSLAESAIENLPKYRVSMKVK